MLSLQAGIYRLFLCPKFFSYDFRVGKAPSRLRKCFSLGKNSFPRLRECYFVAKIPVSGLGKCNSEVKNPFPESGESNSGLRNLSPKLWNAGAKCETIPQK